MIRSFRNYIVYRPPLVQKQLKLILRDYPNFHKDYADALRKFMDSSVNTKSNKRLSKHVYRIRIGIRGVTGKSGGMRTFYYLASLKIVKYML
ncbi:MAG: hypothetical protein OXC61_04100 [Flavobacteriaceae bacterium]|nr:hypothetical protein [Flavobacteriaceae bacterium]